MSNNSSAVESQKTEISNDFLSNINNQFLEIDHQINTFREKCETCDEADKVLYTEELKKLREEREHVKQMIENYKSTGHVDQEQVSLISQKWEALKNSVSTILSQYIK